MTVSAVILTAAGTSRADESYQPYYYDRGDLMFAHTGLTFQPQAPAVAQAAPVAAPAPAPSVVTYPYDAPEAVAQAQYYIPPAPIAPPQPAPAAQPTPYVVHYQRQGGPPPLPAPEHPITTVGGIEIGVDGAYYDYQQSPAKAVGPEIGAELSATAVRDDHLFNNFDFRYAYSRDDYSSPQGDLSNQPNSAWELRDVVGRDFVWNDSFAVAPFVGLGFRNFYDDSHGTIGAHATDDRFHDEFLYVPIGFRPAIRLDSSDILRMDLEYDYMIHGWQSTHLGDTGSGNPTVHENQDSGYGLRGNIMWNNGDWSFGPFVNYWSVGASAGKPFFSPNATCGSTSCVAIAPHNTTLEGGLQLKYRFVDF